MRVLYDYQIMAEQRYGGVSRYYIELMKEIEKKNLAQVDCKVLFSQNAYLDEYKGIKGKKINNVVWRYAVEGLNRIYTIWWVMFHKYDVMHFTWNNPYLMWYRGTKKIVTIHDMIHEKFMPEMKREIYCKKEAIYRSDRIIAISENTKKDILELYPDIPRDKITVIYHGTNHLPNAVEPSQFNVPHDYLLYVGGRKRYKNGEFLMRNLASLLCEKQMYIIFAGGGEFSNEEKLLIRELGIEKYVLQENVSDEELAYLYQHAIAFVYPSEYEGFGFPILEAFDNQCPVVCCNSSSLPEVAGDAALYFNSNENEKLEEHIVNLMEDVDLRALLINRGKERSKMFTWEETANKTLDLYKKVNRK